MHRRGADTVVGERATLAYRLDRVTGVLREAAGEQSAEGPLVDVARPPALGGRKRDRAPVDVAVELRLRYGLAQARVGTVEVLSVEVAVEAIVLDHHDRRGEEVETDVRIRVRQLRRVERPGRVRPVERTDQTLLPETELLATDLQGPPVLVRLSDLDVGLPQVEIVLVDWRIGVGVEPAGLRILALQEDPHVRAELEEQVEPEPAEDEGVVVVVHALDARQPLEAHAVLAAEAHPLGQLFVDVLGDAKGRVLRRGSGLLGETVACGRRHHDGCDEAEKEFDLLGQWELPRVARKPRSWALCRLT